MAKKTDKKIIDDEVSRAWEALKKKKTEEEKNEEEEEKEENLEGALELKPEKPEFVSVLPEKAPSLELTGAKQNLENTIGPFLESEEKEEKISYSPKKKEDKGYVASKEPEEEQHYENPMLLRAEFTAPQIFQESEIVRMAKGALHAPEKEIWGKEYISAEEKELSHEKLEREKKESVKKYKPQM